jgi:catechol 2,3-dioxygenase-like lactoylglutathione lyase family enzyme
MGRGIHFELNADDPERAAQFYRRVFGWTIDKWDGPEDYWLVTTGPESEPGIAAPSPAAWVRHHHGEHGGRRRSRCRPWSWPARPGARWCCPR